MANNNKIKKDIERPLTLGRTIDNPIAKGPRVLAPVRQTNSVDQSLMPSNKRKRPVRFTPMELLRSKFNPDTNWQLNDEEFLYNLQAERGGSPVNPKLWREAMTGAVTGNDDYSRRYSNNFALGGAPVIMSAPAVASVVAQDPSNTWLGAPQQQQNPLNQQLNPAQGLPQNPANPQNQAQGFAYGGNIYDTGGRFSAGNVAGMAGGALSAVGQGIGLAQINSSNAEAQLNQLQNYNPTANSLDSLQEEWGQFQPMDDVSWKDIRGGSKGSRAAGVLSSIGTGAASGAIAGGIGAPIGAIAGLGIGLAGLFTGNRKAKKKARRMNEQIDKANERALSSLETRADALETENNWNTMANFSAYGGPLGDHLFSEGGDIHIKPSKKGTFTKAAKEHGMSVQAFASRVLANKDNYSPAMVKKANFSRNAAKWSHAYGGELDKKDKKPSFEDYYKTVPVEKNDTTNYDLRRAYNLAPYEDMVRFAKDKDFHLGSVYENPQTGEYDFVKSKNHPTVNKEIEWYNSGAGKNFREQYDLDTTGQYYKYVPKNKKKAYGGPLLEDDYITAISSYANGGHLNDEYRTDFTEFNTGGTHEESPLGGIPIGKDETGQPNLVEEGETKYKDYVFSDRLGIDDVMLEGSGLPSKLKGKTFSDASKELSKEAKERPNDPISKRTMKANMEKLMTLQEGIREAMASNEGNRFDDGGTIKKPDMMGGYTGFGQTDVDSRFFNQPDYSLATNYLNGTSLPSDSYQEYPKDWTLGADALRYAPAVGSLVSMFMKNKPNYSDADRVERARQEVSFSPLGNYLTYKPMDRNYYINQLNAQSGATKRGIVNQSGGNRATATAGLLAADYNYNQGLGALARQSEEYNQAQRERVEAFNRGTNQYNSQGALQAGSINANSSLAAASTAAQMRSQERAMSDAAKSSNYTNFFDNLGEIGREEFQRNMISSNPSNYYKLGRDGKVSYKNMDALTEDQRKEVIAAAKRAQRARQKKSKSHGGFLTL